MYEDFDCNISLTFARASLLLLRNCEPSHRLQTLACKICGTFVVQVFKRIQSPLSLALSRLLITRSGVLLTASSKVKYRSGMATSLRFMCCAKSSNNTPVSIPSKNFVLEFDSFMRCDSIILLNKVAALDIR